MCVHHARDKTGMVYKEQGAEVVSLSALFKWYLLYHIHGMSYIKLFFLCSCHIRFHPFHKQSGICPGNIFHIGRVIGLGLH